MDTCGHLIVCWPLLSGSHWTPQPLLSTRATFSLSHLPARSAEYIGDFEIIDDHRSGKIVVTLNGRINKVGVISPRFDMPMADIEKWTNNLLPSRQFGHIVLTTSAGIFDHEEARRKRTGGKVSVVDAAAAAAANRWCACSAALCTARCRYSHVLFV